MSVNVAETELLLDSLMEDPNVKAAVVVDGRGYVIDRRGSAASLHGGSPEKGSAPLENATKHRPSENLYLVQAGDDYLIVVFDDRINFERIKSSVDETLAEFDMAPAKE